MPCAARGSAGCCSHTPFCLDQGLGQRLAAAALADEVHEVGQPALLGGELCLLELRRVRKVRPELGDLLLDAVEDVGDVLGVGDLLLDRSEERPSPRACDGRAACAGAGSTEPHRARERDPDRNDCLGAARRSRARAVTGRYSTHDCSMGQASRCTTTTNPYTHAAGAESRPSGGFVCAVVIAAL